MGHDTVVKPPGSHQTNEHQGKTNSKFGTMANNIYATLKLEGDKSFQCLSLIRLHDRYKKAYHQELRRL